MTIVRLTYNRILQGVSRRICLLTIRRIRYLQLTFKFTKPMSTHVLRAILHGRITKAAHNGCLVPLLLGRAHNEGRIRFLLQDANEGRSVFL